MYRPPRKGPRSGVLDLDSLMDILSCLVGVMLFMVIYTVLELGSTAYQVGMPVAGAPASSSRAVVVIARDGTVRPIDVRAPVASLLQGFDTVSFAGAPDFIRRTNLDSPVDDYFLYELDYEDQIRADGLEARSFLLRILEVPGAVGDSVQTLDEESRFSRFLDSVDRSGSHIVFAVDSLGLDVFRAARQMASERGFTTAWAPFDMTFPLSYTLSSQGTVDLLTPREAFTKPAR